MLFRQKSATTRVDKFEISPSACRLAIPATLLATLCSNVCSIGTRSRAFYQHSPCTRSYFDLIVDPLIRIHRLRFGTAMKFPRRYQRYREIPHTLIVINSPGNTRR